MIYVHHHLGLGDHIVCNAIVRNLYKQYGKIMLAVKEHNYSSVKNLYADLDIIYDVVKFDSDCYEKYKYMPHLRIGFENCRLDWEKSFYDQVNISYEKRFSDFYIKRNFEKEKELEKKLNLPEKFCFCNTKASSGDYNIKIKNDLPVVKLEPITENLFDWIGVIEKATEIYTIDSSIFQLIKQLKLFGKKFFLDIRNLDKTRTPPTFENSEWEIIVL